MHLVLFNGITFGFAATKSITKMTLLHLKIPITLFVAVLALNTIQAQNSKKDREKEKAARVQSIVSSKDFVFIAESALPTGGRSFYLTSTYNVSVLNDSVLSDLPYFGRAYSAPLNPAEGGIKFTSTNFDYKVQSRKRGGWDILITPKDTRDVRQLFLTASEDGYASLQVTSNNRQPISFRGYIKERKK